jgi:internalin A
MQGSIGGLTKLERLNLKCQKVRDITLLTGLTRLKGLDLSWNQVTDISPLTNLTNLKVLDLSSNQITDISPVSNLTNLKGLWLSSNQISDVNPLAGLTKLVILALGGNQIGDISPLSVLTNLLCLFLGSNRIGDVSSLANLTDLRGLYLEHNRIQNISPLVTLAAKRMDPALVRRREDKDWVEIAFKETERMANVPDIGTGLIVDLRGNPLNDEAYEVHIPALERHTWHEGKGAPWSKDSLRQQRGVQVRFHPKPSGEVITFSDQEVEAAIRKVLEMPEAWRPIYPSDLVGVRDLKLGGKNASDLSWIQHCINLQSLNLQSNRIADIAPLSKLSKLRMLDLSSNRISDISSLRSLTELRVLHLDDNLIEDISAVQSLTKVGMGGRILLQEEGIKVHLGLSNNQISDISPLVGNSGIGKQDQVDLRGNPLSEDSINKLIPELQKRGVEVLHDKHERE